MKQTIIAVFMSALAFGAFAAEDYVYETLELRSDNILVEKDGTGIIKNVECKICTSNILKITDKTQAFVAGNLAGIVQARREYAGKVASIRFNVKTREVETIRW
jgi:hypothetical protein